MPASLTLRALWAPKEGNSEAEYEDAFAPTGLPTPLPNVVRVALADGASSSIFAREWAGLLAEAFAALPFVAAETGKRLALLGQLWRRRVASDDLPWYAQEKLAGGSHATLLVVAWDRTRDRWLAHAVGDACLFVIRENRLRHAFPVTRSQNFDNHPDLLGTEGGAGRQAAPPFREARGVYRQGDRFLLMTDALAAWFLAEYEAGRRPWNALPTETPAFREWLRARRSDGTLRNDDVTLLEVTSV